MLTLLTEIHFWSVHDDISIKETDYGAFKYNDKKDETSDNFQSKKLYAEKRNYIWTLMNKRPNRLRDKIKEIEDQISQNKIVYYKWSRSSILKIMLNTGLIINICVNERTGDVEKISFDKYLIGKLHSSYLSDVLMTRSHLLCTYNDTKMTVVHFTKKELNIGDKIPLKLARLDPQILMCDLAGPSGRRLERRMSSSSSGDRVLVWWRCTRDEVYPWSPIVKDQDRANIHVYTLYGTKLELICYRRTEFDLLDVTFDVRQPNTIHCVQQKVSRRGAVSIEASSYEISRNRLELQTITSIPLQTHVSCHAFNPDGQKLVLGCIDGSVVLFDRPLGVTCVVKAAFIPTLVSWHPDGGMLLVANERCQMQWFDLALSCIKSQTISEDHIPANILDFSSYFRQQPTLLHFVWNTIRTGSDALLLLIFEQGPIAMLRLFDNGCLTPDALVAMYVREGHIELALSVLLALNWENSGTSCFGALQHIVNHLFRVKLTPNVEQQIQRALGSFYAPLRPLSSATKTDFGDQVTDMTRRFFHILVRHKLYEKAFCLAIDIGDHDLFMDLHQCARLEKNSEMAAAALARANELLENANSDSEDSHSMCSRSDCSQCSESDMDEVSADLSQPRLPVESIRPPLPTVTIAHNSPPPLPSIPFLPNIKTTKSVNSSEIPLTLKHPIVNDYSLKINTPKLSTLDFPQSLHEKQNETDVSNKNYFFYNMPYPKLSTNLVNTVHVHRTVSMNIPPAPTFITAPVKVNVPLNTLSASSASTSDISIPSKNSGEKNVKFSDTVTAFIVPELPRSDKIAQFKNKRTTTNQNPFLTDPKQELADSLPLCHPNDDYLKDFTPISTHSEEEESGTKIKVVHFGMV